MPAISSQYVACKCVVAWSHGRGWVPSTRCMGIVAGTGPRINASATQYSSPTHSHTLAISAEFLILDHECARLFSHLLPRPVTVLVTWTRTGYPAGRFHLDNASLVVMKQAYPRPRFNIPARSIRLRKQADDIPVAALESSTYPHSGKGSCIPKPDKTVLVYSGADPRSTQLHTIQLLSVYFKVRDTKRNTEEQRGHCLRKEWPWNGWALGFGRAN